jgi:hypothetical protein
MKIYCLDCQDWYEITAVNIAATMPTPEGNPTVCPLCQRDRITLPEMAIYSADQALVD